MAKEKLHWVKTWLECICIRGLVPGLQDHEPQQRDLTPINLSWVDVLNDSMGDEDPERSRADCGDCNRLHLDIDVPAIASLCLIGFIPPLSPLSWCALLWIVMMQPMGTHRFLPVAWPTRRVSTFPTIYTDSFSEWIKLSICRGGPLLTSKWKSNDLAGSHNAITFTSINYRRNILLKWYFAWPCSSCISCFIPRQGNFGFMPPNKAMRASDIVYMLPHDPDAIWK